MFQSSGRLYVLIFLIWNEVICFFLSIGWYFSSLTTSNWHCDVIRSSARITYLLVCIFWHLAPINFSKWINEDAVHASAFSWRPHEFFWWYGWTSTTKMTYPAWMLFESVNRITSKSIFICRANDQIFYFCYICTVRISTYKCVKLGEGNCAWDAISYEKSQ